MPRRAKIILELRFRDSDQRFGTGINPCMAQVRDAMFADNVINLAAGGADRRFRTESGYDTRHCTALGGRRQRDDGESSS